MNQNKLSMKNTKHLFAHLNIVCIVIMAIALICAVVASTIGMRMMVCGAAVALVGGLYAVRGFLLQGDFADMAMAQLTKRGLSCSTSDRIVYSRSESAYTMTANSDMKRAAKKIMKAIKKLEYRYEGGE